MSDNSEGTIDNVIIDNLCHVLDLGNVLTNVDSADKTLTLEKIKTTCQELLLKLHPDKNRNKSKEEATKIRAETDKEKTILVAEAYKQEQAIRGEGDGMSTKIYADAFGKDPKFFSFMRSMEAYKKSLKTDTTLLMSEKSDFLGFLNKSK